MRNLYLTILILFIGISNNVKGLQSAHAVNNYDSGKIVLYIFTGSDWCANCKRLEKNIFSDSIFIKTLDSLHISLNFVDFPQRKKQPIETKENNAILSEKFEFNGIFPTLILSSPLADKFLSFQYKDENTASLIQLVISKKTLLNE